MDISKNVHQLDEHCLSNQRPVSIGTKIQSKQQSDLVQVVRSNAERYQQKRVTLHVQDVRNEALQCL